MYILGYSGLHNSIAFRKKMLPGLSEQEYRMCQGLDSAACLVSEGVILAAAEEERFNKEKFTTQFPIHAIHYCLSAASITIDQVDHICHGYDYSDYRALFMLDAYNTQLYQEILSPDAQKAFIVNHWANDNLRHKFVPIKHHLAHAASAFYPSGFKEALIIVADGIAEVDSISVIVGQENNLIPLKNYNLFSSLGILYSIMTDYLGFEPNADEYKIMGLAPYGDPERYRTFFEKLIVFTEDGGVLIQRFTNNKTTLEKQTNRGFKLWLQQQKLPFRRSNEPIRSEHHDIAAALQQRLVQALEHIVSYWQKQTGLRHLCFAGGVALNCVANGSILRSKKFDAMYVPPVASDSGTALGAALYQTHKTKNSITRRSYGYELPFYGPIYSNPESLSALSQVADQLIIEQLSLEECIIQAATMIADGQVIAWMQGRMEYGPRALGNRSILANPGHPHMRTIVNQLVKKRETFRPFAPSVKLEAAHLYFEVEPNQELPHMTYTVPVRLEYQARLPAITHINGSARIQTVNREQHTLYWRLLDAVETKTGFPIVLNTSFNIKGQPIVCSPKEAISTLLATKIDALFLGNYYVRCRENMRKTNPHLLS